MNNVKTAVAQNLQYRMQKPWKFNLPQNHTPSPIGIKLRKYIILHGLMTLTVSNLLSHRISWCLSRRRWKYWVHVFHRFFLPFLEKSAQRKLLVRLSRSIHIRLMTSRWSRKCLWGLLYQIVYSGRSKLLLQDLPLWPNAEIPAEFTNLCPFWTMSETKDFNRPFACTVSNRAQNFRSGAPQATGNTLSP